MNEHENNQSAAHASFNAADLDLARFDEEFKEAPVEERKFEPVPDGKYQVNIEKVELAQSQAGNPMLKWTLRILGPKCAGRLLFRHNVMVTKENIKWLKGDLHLAGLPLEKLSDLPGRLEELLDAKLEVTKRTKGESETIYFNKKIVLDPSAFQPADPAAQGQSFDTAMVPF